MLTDTRSRPIRDLAHVEEGRENGDDWRTALRPYQHEGICRVLDMRHPLPQRHLWVWDPGAGKTLGALALARQLGAKRILVAGGSLARPVWLREFAKWMPTHYRPASIRWGTKSLSLSKTMHLERASAYAASVQVTSYALMHEAVMQTERDLVILDESHYLADPTSDRSQYVKDLARRYPKMPIVALSATPVTTDPESIWNIIDTLFPGLLGRADRRTGGVPWSFKYDYMNIETNRWGTRAFGARQETMPLLAKRLAHVTHRVTEDEFAKYLPPLRPEVMWIDTPDLPDDLAVAKQWIKEQAGLGRTRIGVFTHHIKLMNKIAEWARAARLPYTVFSTHGTGTTTEERVRTLEAAAVEPQSLLVATIGAFRESVSLSYLKDALVCEWQGAPAGAVQFLGRFGRADSETQAPTLVRYVAFANDEAKADTLRERLEAIAALYKENPRAAALRRVFSREPLDESQLQSMFTRSFSSARVTALDESWDDDE